ncbi:MAG: hypothetical protein Kow0089_02030 [Desulfobulbaceae bacterium]
MKKQLWIAAAVAALLGGAPDGWADTMEGEHGPGGMGMWMDAGVESWSGDITYRIGYPVTDAWGYRYDGYFPFSELEFPLDAEFGVVKGGIVVAEKYLLGIQVKKNLNDPDDDMEDRDWITESDPSRLDIYSNSTVSDFSAFVIDVDASYRFINNEQVRLAAGIGYMYQDFEYDTVVQRQWSPSGLEGFDYVGDGTVSLIYEVDCEIPYVLLSGQFNLLPNLKINGRFAFAPWVDVDDRDQHLLRSKVNEGDMSGTAFMVSADLQYDFTPQLFATAGFNHTYIDVDGDMDAAFYGVYDHTVAEELESNQYAGYVTVGFRFGVPGQR